MTKSPAPARVPTERSPSKVAVPAVIVKVPTVPFKFMVPAVRVISPDVDVTLPVLVEVVVTDKS